MSIRKITDGEIAAASVARLSDRPNESGGYGKSALTASELRKAFDALGKLCAARYNELCDALTGGSAAKDILVGDKSLEEIFGSVDEKADAETVAEGFLEVDGVLRSLAAESEALKKLTASQSEQLLLKLDTARYLDTPAVKGAETVKTTVYPFETSFPIEKDGEGFVIRKGASVPVGSTVALSLLTFPVTAGDTYFVYTDEDYAARYYADTGGEMHTHISDGLRLRVTLDTNGDGKEDKVYKLTNAGVGYDRLRTTSEPVSFYAEKDGTATVTLSIYNKNGMLAFPYADEDAPLTLRVSRIAPGTPLVLGRDMKPVYCGKEKEKGDTLLSVPMPDGDAFGVLGLPVSVSGNLARLSTREDCEIKVLYDEEGATILSGSRQPCGMWCDLTVGEFTAERGRTYSVFTRESHTLGKDDGYYLTVFDGERSYGKSVEGRDTRVPFTFTANKSGKHKVRMHIYCDDVLVPEEYTEDYRITAFVRDVTANGRENISGNFTVNTGENTILFISALPSGKRISDVDGFGVKIAGCRAGDTYTVEIEDGNGKVYKETRNVSGNMETFMLDFGLWTAEIRSSAASPTTLLFPFGRENCPSTAVQRMSLLYHAASSVTLRYNLFAR